MYSKTDMGQAPLATAPSFLYIIPFLSSLFSTDLQALSTRSLLILSIPIHNRKHGSKGRYRLL